MSKTEEDEVYEAILDMVGEPPYQWHGGAEVAPEDRTLYALLIFFMARIKEGKAHKVLVTESESQDRDKVVMDKLAEGGWTVLLKSLPNPSEVAWGYCPERQDYAGAGFIAGEPKRLMKKAVPDSVIRCPLPSAMRKVMQDIAPH